MSDRRPSIPHVPTASASTSPTSRSCSASRSASSSTAEFSKDYCREVEAREEFPWDLWQQLGEHGLTGVGIPEEYGGQGGGIIEQVILDEELSRTMAGLYWLLGITLFDAKAIAALGTEEQKQRFLPEIAAGRMMFAISITEPGGGTDVLGAMRTRADEGRRRLGRQRHQDLVDARARRRPAVPRRAAPTTTSTAAPTRASRSSSATRRPRA